jgi:hypothetical protein
MVVPPAILLEPDPQILCILCTWVDDHPVQGPVRARSSGATEADSLVLVYDLST